VYTHCHIDLYQDPSAVVEETEKHGVYTIAVTNAPSVFFFTEKLVHSAKYVRAAAGLHPELIHTHGHELEDMLSLIGRTRYVGEVGLDYTTPDAEIRRRQKHAFSAILSRCADYGDRILTIHSRRAAADVIASIGTGFPGTVIFHWFSGSNSEADRAASIGAFFSINPAMLKSKKGCALIERLPRDRILIESDGPFVSVENTPARPVHAKGTTEQLADIWGEETREVASIVFGNFKGILNRASTQPTQI
jgi:TatD DNase family protein